MSSAPFYVALIDNLIDFMRSHLTDKRTDRAGKQWIYPEYPRADAMRPRISVVLSGLADRRELGFGEGGQRLSLQLDIDVFTDTKFEWIEPSTGRSYSGASLLSYIASEMDTLFNGSRDEFLEEYGWIDFKLTGVVPFAYDEAIDEHRKTFRYLVELEDTSV